MYSIRFLKELNYRAELMVKEIFDKLRRCDKMIKMKHTGEGGDPNSTIQLPDQTLRWLQTILQLMNYRFIRFLKYSPLSSGLLHYIRYSISYLENRQCYQALEAFAINVIVSSIALESDTMGSNIFFSPIAYANGCKVAAIT